MSKAAKGANLGGVILKVSPPFARPLAAPFAFLPAEVGGELLVGDSCLSCSGLGNGIGRGSMSK